MFTTEKMIFPNFSLPKPIINYFMISINGNAMKKLHKSCKYFYFKNQFTILDHLLTNEFFVKTEFIKYDIVFSSKETNLTFLKDNIWVINDLLIDDYPNPSNITSKIVRCDLNRLTIRVDNISMKELKFLTKSGNIESFSMSKQIYFDDHTKVPPEDLIALVPKATDIWLQTYSFSEKTMKNLIKLERPIKIVILIWQRIEQEINVNLLCQFLEKHFEHGGVFRAWFNDDDYNERFGTEICQKMEKWEPKTRKPRNFPKINIPI